jgi:hypothetical protein
MVFKDKEHLSIVVRPGLEKLINTICSAYSLSHGTKATDVAHEIAISWRSGN